MRGERGATEKGKTMDNTNTVTITLEEYMDLREKANMNGFLMNELGRMNTQFCEIDRRLWELEKKDNG